MKIVEKKYETINGLKQFSLEGKTAIISGAGSGLGLEIAKGMAMAGAALMLIDINKDNILRLEASLKEKDYIVDAVKADITKVEEIKTAVNKTIEEFGKIDISVNCAAITKRMPLEDFNEEDWDIVIDVNLKGTFLINKIVGREMLKQKNGSIINFGSIGSLVAIPDSSAYCSSKGGVAMLTKTAAVEWAKKGVRVNAIIPGTFETSLLKQCIKENPGYEQEMLKRFPIGRFGQPEEIVGACIFLASEASSYVTGQLLYVDGGCLAY